MILVDTSVWIGYLNGAQSKHTDTLDAAIIEDTVALLVLPTTTNEIDHD